MPVSPWRCWDRGGTASCCVAQGGPCQLGESWCWQLKAGPRTLRWYGWWHMGPLGAKQNFLLLRSSFLPFQRYNPVRKDSGVWAELPRVARAPGLLPYFILIVCFCEFILPCEDCESWHSVVDPWLQVKIVWGAFKKHYCLGPLLQRFCFTCSSEVSSKVPDDPNAQPGLRTADEMNRGSGSLQVLFPLPGRP